LFRVADCDTDHYLVAANVRERVVVNKTTHRFRMERFSLKESNEVEGKAQYCVEISNRFSALENLDAAVDTNRAQETIRISKFQPQRFYILMT
jgi:hypothetical protein